ncbi:MAG: rhodanese-like domain-containing protein [Ignavibacteria bacterium]|jgi:rhodanese-related sulfurtransferase
MLQKFSELPVRKRVGILAIILGFIAIFAASPYDRTSTRINIKSIALSSIEKENIITPEILADWIIQAKLDYRLIDLRIPEKYNNYNIPGSENVPVYEILNADFSRNEKFLLYSDDEKLSAQAWFLLKADNHKNVYLLKGGMEGWKTNVLFPSLISEATPEQIQSFEKMKQVSKYFGGQPQIGNSKNVMNNETPVPKSPPKINVIQKKKKKSREGC